VAVDLRVQAEEKTSSVVVVMNPEFLSKLKAVVGPIFR
jgi:UDP-glucose 6-dehydrogenase